MWHDPTTGFGPGVRWDPDGAFAAELVVFTALPRTLSMVSLVEKMSYNLHILRSIVSSTYYWHTKFIA